PFGDLDLSGVRDVIDLGSGAGLDACLIAQRLAPDGRVIAFDLTPAMLELARQSADGLGAGRVLPLAGDMERLPLADGSIDLVLANASFNLALDKQVAFSEAARILRPGGRLAACDLVRNGDLPADLRADPQAWNTSLGGVIGESEMHDFISKAGFEQVRISGHRPFPPVTAVHIQATKPVG
ncbi:MAG: methyltransferase domain-containing protein, partial [Rhodospirillales bacterium]|nr:methyltransferase domain-containing protein [Rhodospirillales bacterium]